MVYPTTRPIRISALLNNVCFGMQKRMRLKIHERLTKNVSLHLRLKIRERLKIHKLGKMHGTNTEQFELFTQ